MLNKRNKRRIKSRREDRRPAKRQKGRKELGYGGKVAIMSIATILGILTVIFLVLLIYFRGLIF